MKNFFKWLPRQFIGIYFLWILAIAVVFALDGYRAGDLIHYLLLLSLPPLSAIAIYIFREKK
jgi:hypothetical protein